MTSLPPHGRVACTACFEGCGPVAFDRTRRADGAFRITANPLAWGHVDPEVIVLGFSKGPTQAGALAALSHDAIAYKGGRKQIGRIFRHVGLLPAAVADGELAGAVSQLIATPKGRFHFGSLVRCTVEQDTGKGWTGTGAGMLDKFVASDFGQRVVHRCVQRHLARLNPRTRLVLLFGLGTRLNYVRACHELMQRSLGGEWRWINEVAYTNGHLTVVHVEHFKSQGAYLPQWLGQRDHPRQRWGVMAQQAVRAAMGPGWVA